MENISFDIAAHWLPVSEKIGSIEKDSLRIKVVGINYHTKPEPCEWGIFSGYIKPEPDNQYDPNAIAFYKSSGQLVGYVQKELQEYVSNFCHGNVFDCIIAISPFFSAEGNLCNQSYAYILKFFEDDVEYASEMINKITEVAGNDVLIDIQHIENKVLLSSESITNSQNEDDEEDNNTVFRYEEFYKFPQGDKSGKKTYDTLTVRIDNADWFFDRKKWQAGVFSGYLDRAPFKEYNNTYGIYREDDSLVGWPDSLDYDDKIRDFVEGHRIYCIFSLVPKMNHQTCCIEIKGKAVLIKFFENEKDYARKLFDDTRTRLAKTSIDDYKKFNEQKEVLSDNGDSVCLSWSFDTKRYNFGDTHLTYLDDNGKPQKSNGGCAVVIAIISTLSFLCSALMAIVV